MVLRPRNPFPEPFRAMTTRTFDPRATLADLAVSHAGATRVFHAHGLDFCCHGRIPLAEACAARGLDLDELVRELAAGTAPRTPADDLGARPLPQLIELIEQRFHAGHRSELPRLLEMARKVESVHADKPDCPRGLAAHLERMGDELEEHMQKEEQVLFPLIRAGRGALAAMPMRVLESDHEEHGRNLARMSALAGGYVAPSEACNTWRALYLGLAELETELMEHIHLENNVLFPRALRS